MAKKYYLDTCIWLNLFKKEGDSTKGVPYWELTEIFMKKAIKEKAIIFYSDIVLRELQIKQSDEEYIKSKFYILLTPVTRQLNQSIEDRNKARELESKYHFEISFYDLVHLIIAKKVGAILITRDRKLLSIALENDVIAKRPEELDIF